MIKSIFLLTSSSIFLAGAYQSDVPSALKSHHAGLVAAKSLKLSVTSQKLSGGSEKLTLLYSKPSSFKIDSATRLTVSDGKMVWNYNKTTKTYTEEPVSMVRTKDADTWVWSSFFDAEALKGIKEATTKGNRALRGVQVTEVAVKRGNDTFTFYLDVANGVVRGFGNSDSIVFASELTVGKEIANEKEFAFVPPVGATKEEPKPLDAVTYASVEKIFAQSCVRCHSSSNSKGNYAMDSYTGVMKRVKAGDASGSVMFQYIKGIRQPQMPKGGSLSSADLDAIEAWINAGAKN
jgi:outer membrane lipoprotein-sorting protein